MKTQHIEDARGLVVAFLDGKGRHCKLPEPVPPGVADGLDIDDQDVSETGPGQGRVTQTRPRGQRGDSPAEEEARLADGLAAAEP